MPEREIRTILLVDGSASILFYLAMLLNRLEYKVKTVRSTEEALRSMDASLPSIILAEAVQPQMSGLEFLKKVKDTPRFKAIPFVILTAEADPGLRETCSRMGCASFLTKPVEPDVLYRTLQSVSEAVPRANIRLQASLKVVVGDGSALGGAARTEYATAISEGGLFVRTRYPQPRNAATPLSIYLNDRVIRAKAEVLYVYSTDVGEFAEPGMGLKFIEISDEDRGLIRTFIRRQLTSDLNPEK